MRRLLWVVLLGAAGCTGSTPKPPPPSSGAVSDVELARNVSLALDRAGVPGNEFITIDARGGFVTLGGRVPTTAAWNSAVNTAMAVPGVRDVEATGLRVIP